MTELDRETQAAIEALVHRLKNREPGTDDEPFAMEFVQALIGRGWRPTNATRPPAWQPGPFSPASKPPADMLAGLRADLDAKAAAFRHDIQDGAA